VLERAPDRDDVREQGYRPLGRTIAWKAGASISASYIKLAVAIPSLAEPDHRRWRRRFV